jgi:hypothetical protein
LLFTHGRAAFSSPPPSSSSSLLHKKERKRASKQIKFIMSELQRDRFNINFLFTYVCLLCRRRFSSSFLSLSALFSECAIIVSRASFDCHSRTFVLLTFDTERHEAARDWPVNGKGKPINISQLLMCSPIRDFLTLFAFSGHSEGRQSHGKRVNLAVCSNELSRMKN